MFITKDRYFIWWKFTTIPKLHYEKIHNKNFKY